MIGLKEVLKKHSLWLSEDAAGVRADLREADLTGVNLTRADLREANLIGANLREANLREADLIGANLTRANLTRANLREANLTGADLIGANLTRANLTGANLREARGLVKLMGVEPENIYWKRFGSGLVNNNYQFCTGRNNLRDGETFASDDRETCSYPGFHFASRSWCATNYEDRPFEARIRIPEDAQINEPWATDGKASASAIEILQVFDTRTGEDVTNQFMRTEKQ